VVGGQGRADGGTKNKTSFRSLDVVNADARVDEVYQDSDGIRLEPAKGWTADPLGAHAIHETTVNAVLQKYRGLQPCSCSQCSV
jgi:hypothetical protein